MSDLDLNDIKNWPDGAEISVGGRFIKWVDGCEHYRSDDAIGWERSRIPWRLEDYLNRGSVAVVTRPKAKTETSSSVTAEEKAALAGVSDESGKTKYQREIKPNVFVDVYDVLLAFNVTNPATQHAIKKLLAPGRRGVKSADQDLKEAMQSIERAIELESIDEMAFKHKV